MKYRILLPALMLSALLAGSASAQTKFAVVNAGAVDHATARGLLRLYDLLQAPRRAALPTPPAAPRSQKAAHPAPRRRAARPAAKRRAAASWTPVRGRTLRRALVGLPHDESLSLAQASLEAGQRLFTALKREKAAEAFVRAIARLDRQVPWARARKPLILAHTYLLLCYHALGRSADARPVAARLRELTGNHRPPGIPAAAWQAYPLQPLPLTPRRKLVVKAPPLAKVYLDDHLAGTGPQQLPAGPGGHRVRVELEGHQVFFQEVAPGSHEQVVLVTLTPTPEDAYADVRKALSKVRKSGTPFAAAPYRRLAKTLFVEWLLVALPEAGHVKLRWFSRTLGKFASPAVTVSLAPGAKGGLTRARAQVIAAYRQGLEAERQDRSLADQANRKAHKAHKKKSSIWKKWYFWVAAAVVAGVVAGFAIKDSVSEDKVILKITRP